MSSYFTSRSLMLQATILGLLAGQGGTVFAQQRHGSYGNGLSVAMMHSEPQKSSMQHIQPPAPVVRRPPQSSASEPHQVAPIERRPPLASRPLAGHLADWMNQHRSLSLEQQQQALRREPGFSELPAATQDRMLNRLTDLNRMRPEQRQRLLARNEQLEHLSPDQRAQVRGAMQQLGALPPDQRRLVSRDFRELRELPPDQRMAAMTSDHYWPQLNGAQRETLSNLIRVEPMLPLPEPKPLP